jgi:hypothetical protein
MTALGAWLVRLDLANQVLDTVGSYDLVGPTFAGASSRTDRSRTLRVNS